MIGLVEALRLAEAHAQLAETANTALVKAASDVHPQTLNALRQEINREAQMAEMWAAVGAAMAVSGEQARAAAARLATA